MSGGGDEVHRVNPTRISFGRFLSWMRSASNMFSFNENDGKVFASYNGKRSLR